MRNSEKDFDSGDNGDNASTSMGAFAQIDKESERRVLSKFDCADAELSGNARVFGFEESTGMSGTDFNNISMFFYIPYIIFETPWVMAVRRFGPGRVLAVAIICWSAITLGTGFVRSYNEVIACRVLLGAFEAGLFPALTFVISGIYPAVSQGKRIAVLYISIALSGALGGLVAYGIQSMGEQHGLEAWRWLFIIEGAISFVIGAICWVSLPGSPETAWFLNDTERTTMSLLKIRDHPYEATDKFSWKQVSLAVMDPMVWLASIALFCSSIAMFGFSTFLPTLLKGMQYANYLSIPVYVLASIGTGITTFVSDRIGRRAICLIHSPILVMVGYAVAVGSSNRSVGYFGMFIVGAGVYSFNTVLLTWVSNNIHPDYKRSVAIAIVVSIGNAAGLAASQIYPIGDAPRYIVGNSISLGFESLALACVALIYMLLRYRTRQKEKLLSEGVESNGKEGDQSLDFDYLISGRHSADQGDGLEAQQYAATLPRDVIENSASLSPTFEQSIETGIPTQWPTDLEQLGQSEAFMQDIPDFWPLDASVMEAADATEVNVPSETSLRLGIHTTLSRHDRSTSFIGYSNESDPFLLEHYPYDATDELDFFMVTYRQPSLQIAARGHPPTHFLQSKPQAALQSQEAMANSLALNDERSLLNELITVDMGIALLRLLLLLNTTTFDPVAVETPFAWSMACSVLAIAQSLGLHVEPTHWKIPESEKRLRRRLWWTVVTEHSWRAVTHGRSTMLRDDDCNVEPVTHADFTAITNEICHNFYTLRAVSQVQNLAVLMDKAKPLQHSLYLWLEALPPSLRLDQMPDAIDEIPDSRASLHIAYFTAHVLLFRALLRPIVLQTSNDLIAGNVLEDSRAFIRSLTTVHMPDTAFAILAYFATCSASRSRHRICYPKTENYSYAGGMYYGQK
ncbi:hypothetical protein PWT90_03788 [Aphanocladium album]|nr:hypothetical protein PWT90_03788 [Aphanocladium album]